MCLRVVDRANAKITRFNSDVDHNGQRTNETDGRRVQRMWDIEREIEGDRKSNAQVKRHCRASPIKWQIYTINKCDILNDSNERNPKIERKCKWRKCNSVNAPLCVCARERATFFFCIPLQLLLLLPLLSFSVLSCVAHTLYGVCRSQNENLSCKWYSVISNGKLILNLNADLRFRWFLSFIRKRFPTAAHQQKPKPIYKALSVVNFAMR